jgi:hypothetical protein
MATHPSIAQSLRDKAKALTIQSGIYWKSQQYSVSMRKLQEAADLEQMADAIEEIKR